VENKISYELELELKEKYTRFSAFMQRAYSYTPVFYELMANADECFKSGNFTKLKICLNRVRTELDNNTSHDSFYRKKDALELIDEIETFSNKMIDKGFDQLDDQELELTEKEELKIKKQKIDVRLKEIQEINAPYLNMSLGLSFILVAIIFYCIPSFFGAIAIYHICSFMLAIGIMFLFNEIKIRQNEKIGWLGYSEKITSKRAFLFLFQSFVYMIPLAVLYFFFSQVLLIKILFFIQIWFCSVIMLNGIALLIICNISKKQEKKFNFWSFILGVITIVGFVIQILQLFEVL